LQNYGAINFVPFLDHPVVRRTVAYHVDTLPTSSFVININLLLLITVSTMFMVNKASCVLLYRTGLQRWRWRYSSATSEW